MDSPDIIPFLPYRLFFLYVEPISAIIGALYAGMPATYLSMILPAHRNNKLKSGPNITSPPLEVEVALYQLSNLYLLFALNEHFVLSSTTSLRTWRRLLFCLLIADFGHLCTQIPLGASAFWRIGDWNAMTWGSIGFVYAGAALRIAFLLGLGLDLDPATRSKRAAEALKLTDGQGSKKE